MTDRAQSGARRLVFPGYSDAGLTNVTMSMEIGIALAGLTGRVLVPHRFTPEYQGPPPPIDLPPARHTTFDLYEIPVPWVPDHVAAPEMPADGAVRVRWGALVDGVLSFPSLPADRERFARFRNGRSSAFLWSAELDRAPVVAVEGRTLGFYSYFFYVEGAAREDLLELMAAVRPRAAYRAFAREVAGSLGPFNAVHIRRGDFVTLGFTPRAAHVDGAEVADNLAEVFDASLPLVVLTDGDRSDPWFAPISARFSTVFADELLFGERDVADRFAELPHAGADVFALVSQLLAAEAVGFAGTFFSTFTGLIHRWRARAGDEDGPMFCFDDFACPDAPFAWCRYAETGSGPFTWNRLRLPVSPVHPAWMREWPEAIA